MEKKGNGKEGKWKRKEWKKKKQPKKHSQVEKHTLHILYNKIRFQMFLKAGYKLNEPICSEFHNETTPKMKEWR